MMPVGEARGRASEPGGAFAKAVKHFFRHLHDARALSRNPLARRLFEGAGTQGSSPLRNRAFLHRIHDFVRQGAEHCRNADVAAGKVERAIRQHTIIMLQCLGKRSIPEVARELGISPNLCYRERADICRRVARFICECDNVPVLDYLAELDEFRSQLDRAVREVAGGDVEASLHQYDLLIRAASSTDQKIEAFCRKVDAALSFAKVRLAETAFSAAKIYAAEQAIETRSSISGLTQAWFDITGAKFAHYRGDSQQTITLMERATLELEPVQSAGSGPIRELYVASLGDLSAALWYVGDRHRAYDYVLRAEESLRTLPTKFSQTRTHITILVWKYRCQLLMSAKAWYPAWERLRGLARAFEAAYASGWLLEAIDALGVITTSTALAGHKAEAIRSAELGLSLAKQQANERLKRLVPVAIATNLMATDYWKEGLEFFSEVNRLEDCEAFLQVSASYIIAARALRFHQFDHAWRLANDNSQFSEPVDLTLKKSVIAAAAAHELGRQSVARTILEALIPKAEALGAAPILRDAFSIAAKVGGDSRLRRKARELSRLLAS